MALSAALANAAHVPPVHDEEDAPLTPSYHPPMSPGMKRATGRSGTSVGDEGPLRSGRWMLRRSEYLKQWYKRWVVLDTSGALITFTSTPKDDAAISSVAVSDVRCAPDRLRAARPTTPSPRAREPSRQRNTGVERSFSPPPSGAALTPPAPSRPPRSVTISSHNFHGNVAYAESCVYVETRGNERGVFLVARTPEEAKRWVRDLAERVAARAPPTPELHRPARREEARARASPPSALASVPREARLALLSPGLTAPPTPALVRGHHHQDARTPLLASYRGPDASDAASDADSASPARSSGGTSRAASASASARTTTTTPRSRGYFLGAGASGSGKRGAGAAAGPASWFVGANTRLANTFEAVADEMARSTASADERAARMAEMAREAMAAKDAELGATRRLLTAESTAASEARKRADVLQTRLEERAAEAETFARDLAASAKACATHEMESRQRGAKLEEARAEADRLARELVDARDAATNAEAENARRAAVERELRASLATAGERCEALAREKTALIAANEREVAELRADLQAAGARAIRAANDAEETLAREKKIVAELEKRQGWKGVFRGTIRGGATPRARAASAPSPLRNPFGVRSTRKSPTRRSGIPAASAAAAAAADASEADEATSSSAAAAAADASAEPAAPPAAAEATPEAAAATARRLFEYGAAPASPAEVIEHLDSPGAHGCRQM